MPDNPLVSIIVRTKDRPKLLKNALRSVAAQTYRPIEVVLVNDGGCDLDVDEIKSILGDVTLNYIKLEKNTGRAHAGNVGIENAKGEYIGFLDDDDELYPEHVEILVSFLERSGYKVAYTDTELVFQKFMPEEEKLVDVNKDFIFSKDFAYNALLVGNYIPFNSILFEKATLAAAGGFDENFDICEDWDLLIRIGQKTPFYHIKKITARYNQWSRDLQINQPDSKHVKVMNLKVINKHLDKITPEIILDMRTEREQMEIEIKNLKNKYSVFEASSSEKGNLIMQLKESLRERDNCIMHLNESFREKDKHILKLEETLNLIRDTLGWKALEKFRRFREKALPQGSRRRRIYDLIIKNVKVISWEGFRSFFVKAGRKLNSVRESRIDLAKRAYSVLKTYGFKTFLQYTYKYLMHGRGYFKTQNVYSQDIYERWIERNENWDEITIRKEIEGFTYKPKISIITPVYNVEAIWLNKCIKSVMNQFYDNWELCLHDDASTMSETVECLKKWENIDKRIKVSFGETNKGISGASNQALQAATGEFIAFLDHDDELSPDALYESIKILNVYPDTDVIYSDEDRITETDNGIVKRFDPFFKPEWSPQLLFACMYTGHLSVYRKTLIDEVGGFRSEYDFSQDYDLALRITEKTNRIKHIPKILYHWRSISGSAAAGDKKYARRSNIGALRSTVERRGYDAEVLEYPFANRVKFNIRTHPLVSIIIPSDNKRNVLNCIELLLKNTSYPNFEIIVVTNSRLAEDVLNYYHEDERIKLSKFDKPFSFSLKCNEGASLAKGEYLLFLNDDVEAIDNTWLEDMAGVFGKGNIGGVSPKLFYEDNTIQYAGMVTGVRGLVGTAFHCQPKDSAFYFNLIQSERNVQLLSGACLLIPKHIFEEVGGFDVVNTPIMHSDIDLCFKVLEKGYELVYMPFASLRHIGHLSLREMGEKEKKQKKDCIDLFILKKWGDYLSADPFYTDNMREFLYKDGSHYYKLIAARQEDKFLSSKNILFVTHDLSLSGAPILLYYLACHFKKLGYFISVISPYDGELAAKYKQENIPIMIDSTVADNPHEETKKFMTNFDLIFANTLVMWPSIFVAKELNVPVIWLIHESLFGVAMVNRNDSILKAFSLADDIVFIGGATASLYQGLNIRNNFKIINYGAPALTMDSIDIIRDDRKLVILHIGSIEWRKGQDVLIKSISKLPERYVNGIEVYLIGRKMNSIEGEEFYNEVIKLSEQFKNIHLVGEVSHERINEFMNRADIFVCSSRDEVGPLTVLEAMSVGKAIISTNVGGVSVMIRNNEDGIIIPNEDIGALARSIIYLHDNREEIKRLGENARRRFYENYTIEKFCSNILNIVEDRIRTPV